MIQRRGEAYWKDRSVIRKEDDVDGRATVTKDEERVKDAKLRLYTFNRYEPNQSDNLAAWNRIVSNVFGESPITTLL